MSTYTYDIYTKGIEQGGWSGSSATSRSDRVRDTDYTEITTRFVSPKVIATCNTGKTVQINFYGYNSSKSLLCDLYWYDSPRTFDVSSYSGLKYFRIQLRYSDNSEITPSQITSLKVEVEVPDQWYIDDNGELNINNLAEEIEGDIFTSPYPSSFWNFISSTDTTLTLNDEYHVYMLHPIVDKSSGRDDNKILTEPYPASLWYLDEHGNLTSMLLPEPINSATLVKPYPASLWYLEPELDNTLCAALLPDELYSGAFLGCANLTYVRIPPSVTRINNNAFYDTALTLVKLPTGCVYEKHAFPPDCEIQFYDV